MKQALRQLGHSPAVSVAVVLSVGLALGGNAAILTAVDAALVRALPYQDAASLVQTCRSSRPVDAPIARRTANSCSRAS